MYRDLKFCTNRTLYISSICLKSFGEMHWWWMTSVYTRYKHRESVVVEVRVQGEYFRCFPLPYLVKIRQILTAGRTSVLWTKWHLRRRKGRQSAALIDTDLLGSVKLRQCCIRLQSFDFYVIWPLTHLILINYSKCNFTCVVIYTQWKRILFECSGRFPWWNNVTISTITAKAWRVNVETRVPQYCLVLYL